MNAKNKLKKVGTDSSTVETSATVTASVTATDSHSDSYSHQMDNTHSTDVEKAQMTQLEGARAGEHHDHDVERLHAFISDDDHV